MTVLNATAPWPNVIKMVPLMLCEFYLNSKRETETTTERERERTKRREEKEGKHGSERSVSE